MRISPWKKLVVLKKETLSISPLSVSSYVNIRVWEQINAGEGDSMSNLLNFISQPQ